MLKSVFTILIGNAEDQVPRKRRKKDFLNESSKSANRSSRKESEREEIVKWESDGLAGYNVESPDGKSTVFFKIQKFIKEINCRSVVS
jgi:hypothetical protein